MTRNHNQLPAAAPQGEEPGRIEDTVFKLVVEWPTLGVLKIMESIDSHLPGPKAFQSPVEAKEEPVLWLETEPEPKAEPPINGEVDR